MMTSALEWASRSVSAVVTRSISEMYDEAVVLAPSETCLLPEEPHQEHSQNSSKRGSRRQHAGKNDYLRKLRKAAESLSHGDAKARITVLTDMHVYLKECPERTMSTLIPIISLRIHEWPADVQLHCCTVLGNALEAVASMDLAKMICAATFRALNKSARSSQYIAFDGLLQAALPLAQCNAADIERIIGLLIVYSQRRRPAARLLAARALCLIVRSYGSAMNGCFLYESLLCPLVRLCNDDDAEVRIFAVHGAHEVTRRLRGTADGTYNGSHGAWHEMASLLYNDNDYVRTIALCSVIRTMSKAPPQIFAEMMADAKLPATFVTLCELCVQFMQQHRKHEATTFSKIDGGDAEQSSTPTAPAKDHADKVDELRHAWTSLALLFSTILTAVASQPGSDIENDAIAQPLRFFKECVERTRSRLRRECAKQYTSVLRQVYSLPLTERLRHCGEDFFECLALQMANDRDLTVRCTIASQIHAALHTLLRAETSPKSRELLGQTINALLLSEEESVVEHIVPHLRDIFCAFFGPHAPFAQQWDVLLPLFSSLRRIGGERQDLQQYLLAQCRPCLSALPQGLLRRYIYPYTLTMATELETLEGKTAALTTAMAVLHMLSSSIERAMLSDQLCAQALRGPRADECQREAFIGASENALRSYFSRSLFADLFGEALLQLCLDEAKSVRVRMLKALPRLSYALMSLPTYVKCVELLELDIDEDVRALASKLGDNSGEWWSSALSPFENSNASDDALSLPDAEAEEASEVTTWRTSKAETASRDVDAERERDERERASIWRQHLAQLPNHAGAVVCADAVEASEETPEASAPASSGCLSAVTLGTMGSRPSPRLQPESDGKTLDTERGPPPLSWRLSASMAPAAMSGASRIERDTAGDDRNLAQRGTAVPDRTSLPLPNTCTVAASSTTSMNSQSPKKIGRTMSDASAVTLGEEQPFPSKSIKSPRSPAKTGSLWTQETPAALWRTKSGKADLDGKSTPPILAQNRKVTSGKICPSRTLTGRARPRFLSRRLGSPNLSGGAGNFENEVPWNNVRAAAHTAEEGAVWRSFSMYDSPFA